MTFLPALVQDGVDRDGGLARLAIAQDQLALAAADGDERVDAFRPVCRGTSRAAVHDGRRGALDRQATSAATGPFSVERIAERIDDPSQQHLRPRRP
jgi:hypothetical protein